MPNLRRGMMAAAGAAGGGTQFSIWGFGRNDYVGFLGDGTTTNRSSPVQMGDKSDWTGLDFVADWAQGAINSAGELWVWGSGTYGRLGLGDTTSRSSPTQVGSLTDWAAVSAGGNSFMLAVKTDGTLWSWGLNGSGQLGHGNTTNISSPVQVGSLTDWSSAEGALCTELSSVSFAIKTDGTLWAWGHNNDAFPLGLEDETSRSSPTQSGSVSTWAWVHASQQAGAAIRTDGTLWTWGESSNGQLANGTDTPRVCCPVQVGSLTNWARVKGAGGGQMNSIKTDGTLWAWGSGGKGRLGVGNTTTYSSPVQVGSLTDWSKNGTIQEAAGAVKTDGTLWTWGEGGQGETGQGNTTDISSPAQVGSDTDWLNVTGAGQAMMASRSA